MVQAFYELHSNGLCYRDISFGNGFFDVNNGDVVICDNDNVTANNAEIKTVLGTPDFMAPEIVVRKARPSRETDYFSLSVLLFYLLHIQHPLTGKKILSIRSWDLPAREKLYGKEPVFIFDPNDTSNAAIDDKKIDPLGEAGRNAIPYWNDIYPTVLKNAFMQNFTTGIRNPQERVLGSAWKDVLTEARDSIFSCENCGSDNFFDSKIGAKNCWSCKKICRPKFQFELGDHKIALAPGTKIYKFHIENRSADSQSPVVGEVVQHPHRPEVWGIKNLTKSTWAAQPDGKGMVEVPHGKSVPVFNGTKVTMGNRSGTIRSQA